jgi:hypothetical protein
MESPALTVRNLLTTHWDADEAGMPRPRITKGNLNDSFTHPQVTVNPGFKRKRVRNFSDNSVRTVTERVRVDLYTLDEDQVQPMEDEVDRIIEEQSITPGGDLDHMMSGDWNPMDLIDKEPVFFHTRAYITVVYYVTVTRS